VLGLPSAVKYVTFHFGDRHLDFWQMSTTRDTGSGTIIKFYPENMGIAVGFLLLCALSRTQNMPGYGAKYPQLPANVAKDCCRDSGLSDCLYVMVDSCISVSY